VREEFTKLLLSPRAEMGLELLAGTGLLDVFLPELARADENTVRCARAAAQAAPAEAELRLAALLADVVSGPQAKELCIRLKYPNKSAELVGLLVQHAALEGHFQDTDPALRRLLAKVGPPQLEALLAVAHARLQARAPEKLAELGRLSDRLRALAAAKPPLTTKELALTGGDIMATLGVGPSPQVGMATKYLLEQVLDAPERNTPETLRELLREWQAKQQG
jgi:tRNA nucleotidyltransferase (CCA-adding enzyme)